MKKTIIIMTKSFKNGNYCIAGIDVETGEWIRLVSDNEETHGAAMRKNVVYEDGTEVEVFDIVKVELIGHVHSDCQRENWQYDPKYYWKKVGVSNLQNVIRRRGTDFFNGFIFGNNNQHKAVQNEVDGRSLALLRVENPSIYINIFDNGDKKITFTFTYNGNRYDFFDVSDIPLYQEYKPKDKGRYRDFGSECYIVVSLTDMWTDGFHYKMLAQLFRST